MAPIAARADTMTFNYTGGEQVFIAPFSGSFIVAAMGAKGGDAHAVDPNHFGSVIHGGAGAFMEGLVNLNFGEQLTINVGGRGGTGPFYAGSPNVAAYSYGGGGGGGTFVSLNGTFVEVAGGGGGAGIGSFGGAGDAVVNSSAVYLFPAYGGANGNGGYAVPSQDVNNPNSHFGGGGGGSGVLGDGQDGGLGGGQGGRGLAGGLGGGGGLGGSGGYGGGGGADVFGAGGGGGGYSGGGGGSYQASLFIPGSANFPDFHFYGGDGAGGGASFYSGPQLYLALEGYGNSNGYVQITYTVPSGGGVFSGPPHTPGVPEPASWTTLLLGVGLAGAALRRRRGPSRAVGGA